MAFISTPEPAGEYLAENRSDAGYVPNFVTTFSAHQSHAGIVPVVWYLAAAVMM